MVNALPDTMTAAYISLHTPTHVCSVITYYVLTQEIDVLGAQRECSLVRVSLGEGLVL